MGAPREDHVNRDRRAGFTLIEMLVVMAIIAMSMAIALPHLANRNHSTDARRLAVQIAAYAQAAQSQAMRTGEPSRLVIDVRQKRIALDGIRPSIQFPQDVELIARSARLSGSGADTSAVVFFPDGSSTGATIELTAGGKAYRVAVDWLTGAASMDAMQR